MKSPMVLMVLLFTFFGSQIGRGDEMDIIKISRDSAVEITSIQGDSKGTGFFISDSYIATCFHVISTIIVQNQDRSLKILQDIKIKTNSGEIIDAKCISVPSQSDLSPMQFDFAILKVASKPQKPISIVKFAQHNNVLDVGSEVLFSGYPLATPAMVTHRGMISGIDSSGSIICIQAPINKGNSGGALISLSGEVVGIISMREGGISVGLEKLRLDIDAASKIGSIHLIGVDPLTSIHSVIATLDTYISTGIGYAINIKHLHEYCQNKLGFPK